MDTVWILPPETDEPTVDQQMADGDYVLREDDGDVQIWRVDRSRAEWIAAIPVDQLPLDPRNELRPDSRRPIESPHDLLVALRGITEAVRTRGG